MLSLVKGSRLDFQLSGGFWVGRGACQTIVRKEFPGLYRYRHIRRGGIQSGHGMGAARAIDRWRWARGRSWRWIHSSRLVSPLTRSVSSALRQFSSTPRHALRARIWIGAPRLSCVLSRWRSTGVRRVRSSDSAGDSAPEAAISLTPLIRLAPLEWDKHHPLLRREHPAWAFATGYRTTKGRGNDLECFRKGDAELRMSLGSTLRARGANGA